ncbi:MAG: flagellar filament capping protein FliD [Candidatus Gastranaerophilales bacterium]|nr:flagellar filament capping protein FliD [Candidatus Gastranaerophilales bacterium]
MPSTIQFSGLGSGLPTSDWVTAIINSEMSRLTKYQAQKASSQQAITSINSIESKFSSLRSAIERLTDSNLASTMDLFQRRKATSSDDAIATATATNSAVAQKIKLSVESLATSTVARSMTAIGKTIEGTDVFTSLPNAKLNKTDSDATSGTFSLFVNGQKHEITIEKEDTLNDIIAKINDNEDLAGIEAGIDANGNFEIKVDEDIVTDGFAMGASSDTSNFLNVMGLSTTGRTAEVDGDYDAVYRSVDPVSKVNIEGKILDGSANLTGTFDQESYTFKIGGATFTVGQNTTFADLIGAINRDEDAGVIASYNAKDNKLVITAKEQGKTAIGFEDVEGDFLKQIGLISEAGNSLASQTLGQNAKVYINGSTEAVEVNSNTITADISGLTGVTINLKSVTKEEDGPITLDINQDTDELKSAVSSFVEKFNAIITEIDKKTKSGQELAGEYTLISLRNSLRTMVTDMVGGLSTYNSLGAIGITTGKVGTSVEASTNSLQFDEKKFLEALQENPSEVKALLIGDKSKGITGIFEKLEKKVETALDPTSGYFAARESSLNSSISTIDKAITREQERLDKREEYLTQQFNRMDQYISQMKSQFSSLGLI